MAVVKLGCVELVRTLVTDEAITFFTEDWRDRVVVRVVDLPVLMSVLEQVSTMLRVLPAPERKGGTHDEGNG